VKSWLRSRLAKLLAGALCAGLAATWAVGKVLDKREVDRRDQHEVARMTDKMKTVCVGRFLIDMPEEAQIELGQARIDGFDISAFEETEEEFKKRVADREAQIRAKPDWRGGDKNLESDRDAKTDSGLVGKIFVHSRVVDEGTQGNGLGGVERYRDEGISTEALMHGHGVSIDLFFENRGLKWIEDLPRLVKQLVANPDNRIPAEAGYCMGRVYARDPLKADQREQVMMFARLPRHPDVEITLILSAGLKPDKHGVLARTDAADEGLSMAERMRITRLRSAPREIGGLHGEELAELVVEENESRVHSFWWEVNGSEDNVLVPHVVFKMTTGNGNRTPVPSSLSDGAALGLWDRISSSLRLRPIAPIKAAKANTPVVPLGSIAEAGDRCPQSGWWQCSEASSGVNVLGGQRQYLCKGQEMPQALLLPPQTLWQRMRGLQSSYEVNTRTAWKLVDKRERDRSLPTLPLAQATLAARANGNQLSGKVMSNTEPSVAIGCIAKTGMQCPASGWWRCEESHALDGTRWFAVGSLLPAATFELPSAAFGRTFGRAQAIQRRSVWQLVRHAGVPVSEAPPSPDDQQPPVVA